MDIRGYALKLNDPGFVSGHKSCSGCGFPSIIRNFIIAGKNTGSNVVATIATSCLAVTSTTYPYTSWEVPLLHSAFANTAASASGLELAYKVLKRKGKIKEDIKILAFAGDGGSYDIGMQALSGAIERMHDIVFVCYNNEAYSNTGGQRSGATHFGASTGTTPEGKVHHGKELFRKDLTRIIAAHDIPYVAQTCFSNFSDIMKKAEKAFQVKGPVFINVLSPCTLFWGIDTGKGVEYLKKAVDSCIWPLYEVENGKYKLNYKPKKIKVEEFLKGQGRFKHLFKEENKHIISELQEHVDKKWAELLKLCGEE